MKRLCLLVGVAAVILGSVVQEGCCGKNNPLKRRGEQKARTTCKTKQYEIRVKVDLERKAINDKMLKRTIFKTPNAVLTKMNENADEIKVVFSNHSMDSNKKLTAILCKYYNCYLIYTKALYKILGLQNGAFSHLDDL